MTTGSIQRLVAGIGTLRDMDPVIPAAARLAASAGLPLEILHAFDLSDPFVESYLRDSALPGDPLVRYSEGLQARLEGQVGGLGLDAEVRCRAVSGTAPEVLLGATGDPGALLVVGPTHRGRAGSALLGTTAQRVLHDATYPVLVLRGEFVAPRRVLFCVDLAWPGARRMVEAGLAVLGALAGESAPEMRLLTTVGLEVDLPIAGLRERLEGAARERLEAFAADLPAAGGMEPRVRVGRPAGEILDEAGSWGADLVVVGSHGRTGAARTLLGSVAESVMRDVACSVLVVPPARKG